jgi:hypothetical protein
VKQILGIIYSRSLYPVLSFRFLFPLRFALIVLTGLTLTNIGLRTLAHSTQSVQAPSNPFLEYADVFPGQASQALNSRPFSCGNIYAYGSSSATACTVVLSSGIFSDIETTVWDGLIHQTTFTLHDDAMKIGDLVLLLGNPHFRAYPRRAFFFWNKLFAIVSTTAHGNPPAIRPVWKVTFTDSY